MRVSQSLILLPVAAQVALTLMVLIALIVARQRSLVTRQKPLQECALAGDDFWTPQARQCANNYCNQFELPVLFYAVCAFAFITRMIDIWFLGLAVLFVVTRIVHAVIHLGANRVVYRGTAFLAGVVCVACLWGLLMFRVAAAGF